MELYHRALKRIPGGTQLVSRRPTRTAYGISPIYAQSANGARFTDVDGFEYIDWISGIGSILLGYADPVVDAAVREQIMDGTNYSVNHELEVELAEELCHWIPSAEMVRYAKTGGEACAMAVRIARGVTGKDMILFCGYHGWHDWYLAANLDAGSSLGEHLFPGIEPIGVPQGLANTAMPFPYGDLASLETLLEKHEGKVAAVIMEPLRSELPVPGYLEGVLTLAKKHQCVSIFDEVSTGLRFGMGGAQAKFNAVPDMSVFAKSISNGYAMAMVVGRSQVMEAAAQMFISSTYWSETIGLRAALTTIREASHRNVAAQLEAYGEKLKRELNTIALEVSCPVMCRGVDVHPYLHFDIPNEELRSQVVTLYIQEMAKRGCHGYASFYLNAAQGDSEFSQTCEAARETFVIIRDAFDRNEVTAVLECSPQKDAFRRLVK